MQTRFVKLTGHHLGDGAHEVTVCEKYIREKLDTGEAHSPRA